jgi:hypothetical protein
MYNSQNKRLVNELALIFMSGPPISEPLLSGLRFLLHSPNNPVIEKNLIAMRELFIIVREIAVERLSQN